MLAHPVALGAALIAAGMALIGFIDNFVRVIAAEVSVWEFQLLRTAMALPLLALAARLGHAIRPKRPVRVALRAAVQPAASDYLYFVSRNDGTHVFSRSYADHTRAVHRYQRSRP